MTEIESEELIVSRKSEKVYHFLKDLRNYAKLLPSDATLIYAEEKEAEIHLSGLGKFKVSVIDSKPNNWLKLKPQGKLPFSFDIEWHIKDIADHCTVKGKINAQLNMFIKMIAEPKLKDFVKSQAYKLKDFIENEVE
ncbi:MAG: hypothetical protein H6607_11435 [Flavobacteriales bacterium]|nr:hypothetical protein [Flavobacteriales bacterium]